jgi:hypothetical protein
MPNITPEESFLIQAYALAECYVHLGELEARKDPLIFNNIDRIYGPTGKIMAAQDKLVFSKSGCVDPRVLHVASPTLRVEKE